MSIAVYPRLSELLRTRNLSVAELERQIEQRFGLSVNLKTLYRFTSHEPVHRADLEIAGAVAAVLGVGLGDLFDVRAIPVDDHLEETSVFIPAESRRLAGLFDQQSRGVLSTDEQRELEALMAEYGRRLHDMRVQEYAKQRDISVEEASSEMAADLDRSIAWWRYPHIVFRKSPTGRQAHVLGTGLRVWQVVKTFRALGEDAAVTAEYFEIEPALVEEALAYSREYPDEVGGLIGRHEAFLAERPIDSEGHAGQQRHERL